MFGDFADLIPDFLQEAEENLEAMQQSLDELSALPEGADATPLLDAIFRAVHTIKGGAGMFSLDALRDHCHQLEDQLGKWRERGQLLSSQQVAYVREEFSGIESFLKKYNQMLQSEAKTRPKVEQPTNSPVIQEPSAAPSETSYVRVPLDKMDQTLNNIWEIFLIRSQMSYLVEEHKEFLQGHSDFFKTWEYLNATLRLSIGELEQRALSMRMVSVDGLFKRMKRIVDQYSQEGRGKNIHFVMRGQETELDKKILDGLADPLVHLIRNAMDHGVETEQERTAQGKSATGEVTLSASVSGNEAVVTVGDDGRGLDAEKLLASAAKKGLDTSGISTDDQAYQLIFAAGFSTASEVTDISGRGVGMDAVKKSIERLGGEISIETSIGKGTRFHIRLPLSMSVLPTTICDVDGSQYAVTNEDIVDARTISHDLILENGGEHSVRFRGQLIPCEFFAKAFGTDTIKFQRSWALFVVRTRQGLRGLLANRFDQNHELVIKPLPKIGPKIPYAQGVSILSTGKPIFVLSLSKVCEHLERGQVEREDHREYRMAG